MLPGPKPRDSSRLSRQTPRSLPSASSAQPPPSLTTPAGRCVSSNNWRSWRATPPHWQTRLVEMRQRQERSRSRRRRRPRPWPRLGGNATVTQFCAAKQTEEDCKDLVTLERVMQQTGNATAGAKSQDSATKAKERLAILRANSTLVGACAASGTTTGGGSAGASGGSTAGSKTGATPVSASGAAVYRPWGP